MTSARARGRLVQPRPVRVITGRGERSGGLGPRTDGRSRDERRGRDDAPDAPAFAIRETTTGSGTQRVLKVNGKALRIRDTLVLEDPSGRELLKIQERKLRIRDTR